MKIDFNQYADELMSTAAYKCRNLADARDLVQDTLLCGLMYQRSGKVMEDPRAWLHSVMNRRFYDSLRRKYRRPVISVDLINELPEDAPIYESIERSEEAEAIRRALGLLTGIYRDVMVRFYMKNESVKEISSALNIPESTVKSRLSAGREHMRKDIAMENYTHNSYEPEYLFMSCSGRTGNDHEPFSLVPRDDKIAMNLLILAYEKPITVSELAKAIGIAAAYIEPVISRLVNGGLMKRVSDRVYTDFIIYGKSDRQATFNLEKKYADEHYADIWKFMEMGFAELSRTDYFNGQNEHQKTKMLAYFAVRTLEHALRRVRNELTGESDIPFEVAYPDRPNGGKWFAMANRVSEQDKNSWSSGYAVNGEYNISYNDISVYEYNTCLASGCTIDYWKGNFSPIFYLAQKKKYDALDMINPKDFAYIDTLISQGYFTRENGILQPDIPVISANQRYELYELSNKHAEIIGREFHDMFMDIFRGRAVMVPPHLKSVPEFLKYLWCGCSLTMMIIMNAKENGLFLRGVDYPTPTAYMVTGNSAKKS